MDDSTKDERERCKDNCCEEVRGLDASSSQEQPLDDAELDDILEDALKDFERQNITRQEPSASVSTAAVQEIPSVNTAAAPGSSDSPCLQDCSAAAGSADMKEMENLLKSLMSGDPSLLTQQLSGLDFGTSSGAGATSHNDFTDTLQRTLGDLTRSTQDIQNDEFSEEELIRLMSSLGADGLDAASENNADPDFIPMMQGMMKSLLSKDVLYPSLKDISAQYPTWLQNHRDKISREEYGRYERQYQLMLSIVHEFEAEQPSDSDDIKRQRFERVLDIMQQMQCLGQPPAELIGELPKGVELDEDGLPTLPAGLPSAEQCCVM